MVVEEGEKISSRNPMWGLMEMVILLPHNRMIKPHERNVFSISINIDLLNNRFMYLIYSTFYYWKHLNQTLTYYIYFITEKGIFLCDF